MEWCCSSGLSPTTTTLPFQKTLTNLSRRSFCPFTVKHPMEWCCSSGLSPTTTTLGCSRFRMNCREPAHDDTPLSVDLAYSVLGVHPDCSALELKAAFRAKVKQFHPDIIKDGTDSDTMIRLVIQAYEMLSSYSRSEIIERECLDPFDKPECEAVDIFVNEVLCVGKACSSSCVNRAPHAFTHVSSTGTARAASQGHGEDYQVQLAVGQCPRSCIHYVTPSQRIILEELLDSILNTPFCDTSTEAELLYSLITKATYENNRYQRPKKQPKTSSQHVDWF